MCWCVVLVGATVRSGISLASIHGRSLCGGAHRSRSELLLRPASAVESAHLAAGVGDGDAWCS